VASQSKPEPFTDVVVVIPGILGSTLRQGTREVWGLSSGSLTRAIVSFARNIKRLELPDGIGDNAPDDGVEPGSLIQDLHVIPGIWTVTVGYDRLCGHLRERFGLTQYDPQHPDRPANLLAFAYDWRLSNRYNAKRLKQNVEDVIERWRAQPGCDTARLVLVCHSMGGLIARYYLDVLGGASDARALVTLGTPHRGAANALDALINGVRKGFGPFSADLSAFARSLPALYQLLPEYACIHTPQGLAKTTAPDVLASLPREVKAGLVTDAMVLHDELDSAYAANPAYRFVPVVGTDQPTFTTCRLIGRRAELDRTIDGEDEKGDGTVPRLAARPKALAGDSPALHHSVNIHGHLPAAQGVLDEIDGILTSTHVEHYAVNFPIGVTAADVIVAGEQLEVEAECQDRNTLLEAEVLTDPAGTCVVRGTLQAAGGFTPGVTFESIPPGDYRLRIGRRTAQGLLRDAVTMPLAVLDATMLSEPGQ
jgi:pimeloyl-ACP methyl ester carboxylesterase